MEGNWRGKVRDRRQWWEITGRQEWRGTGEGKPETEDSGGRLQVGGSGGELERESQRQKTVKGDYRKVGVEGNWGGKVRDRRQWWEITGRWEWRGTGEGKSEREDSAREITGRQEWRGTGEGKSETKDGEGRLQEGGSGGELRRESQRHKTVEGDYRKAARVLETLDPGATCHCII